MQLKILLPGIALVLVVVGLMGCDSRSVDKSAFNSAKPELQQIWRTGLEASKASDYVRANTNFLSLLSRNITPNQLVAVQDALASLNERMHTAAAKGNQAAREAVEFLKRPQRLPKQTNP